MLHTNWKKAALAATLAVVMGTPMFVVPSVVMAQQTEPAKIVSKDKAYDHDGMAYREVQDAQKNEKTISKDSKQEMKKIKKDRRPRNFDSDYKTIQKNRQNQNSQGMREIQKNNQNSQGMREIQRNNQNSQGMREIQKNNQNSQGMREIQKNNQNSQGMREIERNN